MMFTEMPSRVKDRRMNIFECLDYKEVLKYRIQFRKKCSPAFTLGKMAESLEIEPSYLSRVINSDRHHFSEDQLYRVLTKLGFKPVEKEYILLLRAYQTTTLSERKLDLENQIRIRQNVQKYGDFRKMKADLEGIRDAISTLIVQSE